MRLEGEGGRNIFIIFKYFWKNSLLNQNCVYFLSNDIILFSYDRTIIALLYITILYCMLEYIKYFHRE